MYACGDVNCRATFRSVADVKQHIEACHPVCTRGLTCKFANCGRKYQSLRSFRLHLLSHGIDDELLPQFVPPEPDNVVNGEGDNFVRNEPEPEPEPRVLTDEEICENIANGALRFTSKLYSLNTMNRSDVDMVLQYSNDLIKCLVSNIRSRVNPDNNLENILEIASSSLDNLSTEAQRFKALESTGALIKPIAFNIDYAQEIVGNINPVLQQVPLTGQFVPIRSVFKTFFEIKDVYRTVLDNYNSLVATPRPIKNIVQGTLWKNVILPKFEGKIVFPITINFDDTEPDNCIGSHSGANKLGPVYYTCPVVPQKFLGALKNIFVAALFRSNDRDVVNGNEKVFHLVLEELKVMETEGILINVDGEEIRLYFALTAVLGDNLGLHSILGFAESFTANFPCRFCRMHRVMIQREIHVPGNMLRTVDDYTEDVETNDQSLTGVFEECVFNQLNSYHVIINPSVDILHDCLEGVAKYDMCKILNDFIYVRQYLTLDDLIGRVDDFFYGPVEAGNRPPAYKLSRDSIVGGTLNFSASEMLCFIRYFGEMVGDLVPENDPVWEFFLSLREIVGILFAPEFEPGTEELLRVLVIEHHTMYQELFRVHFQPKFHYMLHYADLMLVLGPLLHLSTMRWEAKHRELKQVARATNSRINLPYTILLKCMLKLAYRFLSKDGLKVEFQIGSTLPVRRHIIDPEGILDHFIYDVHGEIFSTTQWITVGGVYFRVGMVIHTSNNYHYPCFAIIDKIVYEGIQEGSLNPKIFFVCKALVTNYFNRHLYAFNVSDSNEPYLALRHDDILTPHPLVLRLHRDGLKYISTRYDL